MKTRLRQLTRSAIPPSLHRQYRNVKRVGRQFQQHIFDRLSGTDTAGITADPTGQGKASGHVYEATGPIAFRRLISKVHDDLSDFTFVDVGSGKGAVLLYASHRPFRQVIGVEHAPALHQIAVRNIATYSSRRAGRMRCSNVVSILHDATTYEWPSGPLVVYLFSPVPREATEQILSNLERSLADDPRPCHIVTLNPFSDLYASQRWLDVVHRGWNNTAIFRSTIS